MSRWRNRSGVGLSLLILLILTVAGWLMGSLPRSDEEKSVAKLGAPAQVLFDHDGIPYIYADSGNDAAFALGYAHARDRLWQMDVQRRLTQGRLAEVFGPRALGIDKQYRTLGLYRAAQASIDALDPDVKTRLQAYADGVNAWLTHHDGPLPLEFQLLGYAPKPWAPADSAVWTKLMAMRLSGNYTSELLRMRLGQRLPPDRIEQLWPLYPADAPVTVGDAGPSLPAFLTDPLLALNALLPIAREDLTGASNAWVVSGSRTETGKPILANDPHLGFGAPIIWYLARLETSAGVVAGATVPGLPYVIIGRNNRIAWGLTAAETDQQDVVIERLAQGDDTRYDAPDGTQSFVTRAETIKVKGAPDETLSVRETRHGPVFADTPIELGDGRRAVLALQATFLGAGDTSVQALQRLNEAKDRTTVVAALHSIVAPEINITYADIDGGIGFYSPGQIPVRSSGDGFIARRGWAGDGEWTGFVPFEKMPHVNDPAAGIIVNANNRLTADTSYFLGRDWDWPYRAQRILDMLGEKSRRYGLQDAVRMQADDLSLMAKELIPLMTGFEPEASLGRRVMSRLRSWNGKMDRTQAEPLIFVAWLRRFNQALYGDELGPDLQNYWALRPTFVRDVLNNPDIGTFWCDDKRTPAVESCKDMLDKSFTETLSELAKASGEDSPDKWHWGDFHEARFDHPLFKELPLLRSIADLSIETDGGDDTVNRGGMRIGDEADPFAHVHGAGFRGVYDLADLDRSRFIIATGQSGHILSPNYSGLMHTWRDGGFVVLAKSHAEMSQGARQRITLVPGE